MSKLVITTEEELKKIIVDCIMSTHNSADFQASTEDEELHSIAELAKFLNCSTATAQKLKNSGRIRYIQFGRKITFNKIDLLNDLKKGGFNIK